MNKIPGSDEEDDIESLRLAALQSLKKKNSFSEFPDSSSRNSDVPTHFRGKPGRNKWGRFGAHQRPKTGHFNRQRNTNLIPITPIASDTEDVRKVETNNEPQKVEECSKFNRYNKSDKSDSESETEEEKKSRPGALKKSDSLEALMQELDEVIIGKNAEEGDNKGEIEETEDSKPTEQSPKENDNVNKEENNKQAVNKPIEVNTSKPIETQQKVKTYPRRPFRGRSPNNRFYPKPQRTFPPPNFVPNFAPPPYFHEDFRPMPAPYNRPLSPLAINVESLASVTMAPLSPRSARFVLENRAIIERRKRRSYSRSPSYSPSPPPRRFRRSVSPRRLSRSPRRKRSLSPRRRSPSPKKPITATKPKIEETKAVEAKAKDEESKTLDPVLLARKRKFESNEIKKKEGIIRLKPKEGKEEAKTDEVKDKIEEDLEFQELEKLLNDDHQIEQTKVVDIFSDEESDSDNEGRFKTKRNREKVPALSFTKLVNGPKADVDPEPLPDSSTSRRPNCKRRSSERVRTRDTSRTKRQKITFEEKSEKKIEKNPEKKREKTKVVEEPSKIEEIEPIESTTIEEVEIEESGDEENALVKEGDLRAQLSRKRAEKLCKIPAEEVSTRILKFALEGAGFKKAKKKSKKKSVIEGKLPIHLRLGVNNGSKKEVPEGGMKAKKKSKKKGKSRDVSEQV